MGFVNFNENKSTINNRLIAKDLIDQYKNEVKFKVYDTADYVIPGTNYRILITNQ